ncbi:MarR family winged helix-turn-helix transcriptional regulator [Glutamicibacter sp. PS]|uniref:MarR family winged helix-turn-helix transcriptional regulator n=1 Tax=Glutamicibacter TaxID=1742989 RepID=UPI0028510170|nr:MarR family transcriptional regulator [Glutamicibacter sp. PS]MDR4531979.1 MarR family transcriptional regulator [Glutamicibacter sp. PS]
MGEASQDSVQWLNQDERRTWLALHTVMTLLPATLDTDLQGLEGITLFDYHMLAMLSENEDGQVSMTELAQLSTSSPSRLSHVVKKLEQRGWVERTTYNGDARVKMASLTPSGWDAVHRIAPHHVGTVRALVLDCLDDKDVSDLGRVARKLVKALDNDHWILNADA